MSSFGVNKSVIRQSKFRHTYGEVSQNKYEDVRSPAKVAMEGCFGIVASESWISVPSPAGGAAGAALMFIPVDNTRLTRLQVQNLYTLHNGCGLSDYEFDPFRSNRIVTSGEDCLVKLWEVPSEPPCTDSDTANLIREPLVVLEGHSKKVTFTKFNGVVDNVLATACNGGTVSTWDVSAKRQLCQMDSKDMCQSLEWDYFGKQLCGVFKDKAIRVFDPRSRSVAAESLNSHRGNKQSRATWLSSRNQPSDSGNFIVSCGFSQQAKREMFLWDTRKFTDPVWTNTIDDNSGVIYPFFDECTGLLLLVGKGDGNIRYYEFSDSNIYYLNDYRSASPQRGFCLFPKRVVDQDKNEILRGLKLENTSIQTMSFLVPRRQEAGSSDLYPPCPNGMPANNRADDWLATRENVPPATGDASSGPAGTGVVPKIADSPLSVRLGPVPLGNSTKLNVPPLNQASHEEFKQLKHHLAAAHRTIDEQASRIARLEGIVMSVETPVISPTPKKRNEEQDLVVTELRTENEILREKVIKLMNENARLRMAFCARTASPTAAATTLLLAPPPPPVPVARSPARTSVRQ